MFLLLGQPPPIPPPSVFAYNTPQLYDAPFSKQAMTDLLSGLEHGAQDAKDSCVHHDGWHWWILMRGNGFIDQTQDYLRVGHVPQMIL